MIPKIIHFCWVGGNPYSEAIKQCIATWHEHLPDYEFWLWDERRFDVNASLWTRQAYEAKKWAFVADYIRLYALYHYGGIYLDTDVMVYKSFDPLLHLPYFIGKDDFGTFDAGIMGAEKGTPWIKELLDYYTERPFIKSDGRMDMNPTNGVYWNVFCAKYTHRVIHHEKDFRDVPQSLSVFDKDFFNCWDGLYQVRTNKSYCAHLYAGSWYEKIVILNPGLIIRMKVVLARILPRKVTTAYKHLQYWYRRNF